MIHFRVVTTCHAKGWVLYGRRMAKTFMMYWPGFKLDFYAEGFEPDNALLKTRGVVYKLPQWHADFKARHANTPAMHGRASQKYGLLHDAVRFSHKVGAVIDRIEDILKFREAVDDNIADVIIWLDADVMTHAPVTEEFLTGLVPDWPQTAVAWLNRTKKYPECGFVMFNVGHPTMPALIETWKKFYTEDTLVKLDGWTDCHTLQAAVKAVDAPTASLSGQFVDAGHPFINGPLGAVMDHLKGDRKQYGRSHRADLRRGRKEHYWRMA